MYLPWLKAGIPSTASVPDPLSSAAGRNTRCRVTGMAKNSTTTPKATATHTHPRWLGRLSEICTLRGPGTCDADSADGAGVDEGEALWGKTEETARFGSLLQASSSFNNWDALWQRSLGSRSRQRLTIALSETGTLASTSDAGIARSWVRFIRRARAVCR